MNKDNNYFFNTSTIESIRLIGFRFVFFIFFLKAANDFGKINIDFYLKRNMVIFKMCHYVCEKYSEDKFLTRK